MNILVLIRDFVTIVWPVIVKIIEAIKDKEINNTIKELKKAKSVEEKREAAKKIAESLYRD